MAFFQEKKKIPLSQFLKPTKTPLSEFLKPQGYLKTKLKETTPSNVIGGAKIVGGAIGTAFSDYSAKQAERRSGQTFGQQALTELIKQPAKVISKTAGFFAGAFSETGKTLMEIGLTYAPTLAGKDIGEASNKAQEILKGNQGQQEMEKKLFGFNPTSYVEYIDAGKKFLDSDPNATPNEKKYLPAALAGLMLSGDLITGGGKRKLTSQAVKELLEAGTPDLAKVTALKWGIPEELAEAAKINVSRAKTVQELETAFRGEAANLAKKAGGKPPLTEFLKPADAPTTPKTAPETTIAPKVDNTLSSQAKTMSKEEFVKGVSKKEFRYDDSIKPGATIGKVPTTELNKIEWNQGYVDKSGVKKWEKKIKAGERPYVLVDFNKGIFGSEAVPRIMDGHTRFVAYKNLGFKEIPVIDNANKVLKTKSQLEAIWEGANKVEVKPKPSVSPQEIKVIKKETMEKAKAIYDKKVANIKDAKEILARRRNFIKAVKEQFGLSDADLKTITQRDIRLMSNAEFKTHLDRIRDLSEKLAETRQARNELMAQIMEKNLDTEPLRQAMKLPTIAKMNTKQLREFDALLEPYMKDDVFLSKRKLETIERTELAGIKTYREAREILAKKLGVKPEELNNIKISELDRFKGQSALAEKDPFFKMMVEDTAKLRLIREAEYLEIEKRINNLAKKVQTTLGQKLIPQQKNIRAWFEATDKSTVQLSKAEADLVKIMQDEWIKARDYLIKIQAMDKGRKSENYFTHIRRGILEAVKEDGVIKAFKEVFEQYKLDEQAFNILDTQTGQVLALDKFFKFALRRTGELKPTENIVGAFLDYMKTFKKKQALDEIVPLIDVYAHALTPKGLTKTGLLLHGDMVRFTKEWLNTQKGRRITLVAKQGGKIDWALRAGRTFTTLLDLGLNIPVTIATQVGEQAIQYQLLGKVKFTLAKARALTPKGKRITAKYRNLTGKNPWTQLIEPMRGIGDRLGEGLFVMFQDANVRRNRNFLLGSMTKEEWASETLSVARQTQIRMEAARYGVMDGAGSIIGATPEAGVFTQYKTWALPIVGSQIRNMTYMSKFLLSKGAKESVRGKRALLESYRMLELGAFVTIMGAYAVNQDDESFIGKLKQRAHMEAMTLFGATPAIFSVPRMATYLVDLSSAMGSIFKLEKYKASKFGEYEAGDLKGVNQLQKLLTPRAFKQFDGDKVKTIDDVKAEIKKDIEDGTLTVSAAKEKFISEVKKLEVAEQKARFQLKPEDYKADLKERIESKEITVAEAKEEYLEYMEENVDSFKSPDEGSFIDKILLHAKATGTDPVTTFIFLFQGETIRKIENGAIIVERMPLAESQALKTELGATKEMVLDHTIPLQLGGGNSKGNLKLVSIDEWEAYTEVENYLGNQLRAGIIDKKEAQRLIKDYKNGKITKEDIIQ